MKLDFAESSSIVHIRQGLKDIVGQVTRSQTAQTSSNDVGALATAVALGEAEALGWNERQHSDDKTRYSNKIFLSECFALPHRGLGGDLLCKTQVNLEFENTP